MLKEMDQISQSDSKNEDALREKIYLSKDESIIRYGYNKNSIYVGRRKKSYDVRQYKIFHPLKKFQQLIDKVEKENGVQQPEVDQRLQDLRNKVKNLLESDSLNDSFLRKKITCLLYLTDEMEDKENVDVQISIKEFNQRLSEQYHIAFSELLVDIQRLFPDKKYIVRENKLEVTIPNLETLEYYYGKSVLEEKRLNQESEQLIKEDVKCNKTKKERDYDTKKSCWNCRHYIVIDSKSCCDLDDHVIADIKCDCCNHFHSLYSKKPDIEVNKPGQEDKKLIGRGYCWDCKNNIVYKDSFYCSLDGHQIKNLIGEGCSHYNKLKGSGFFEKKGSSNFEIGKTYSNNEIRRKFKCSTQGGMRWSHKTNSLVLISNQTKSVYTDFLNGGLFHYTGMGKLGNQRLYFCQNQTLYKSNENTVDVHLFVVFEEKKYTYFGRVNLARDPYNQKQKDENGKTRYVWVFPLKLKNDYALDLLKKDFEKYKCEENRFDKTKQDLSTNKTKINMRTNKNRENESRDVIQLMAEDVVIPSQEKCCVKINYSKKINCKYFDVRHPNKNFQDMINEISNETEDSIHLTKKAVVNRLNHDVEKKNSRKKTIEYNKRLFDVKKDKTFIRLVDKKTGIIRKIYKRKRVRLIPKEDNL